MKPLRILAILSAAAAILPAAAAPDAPAGAVRLSLDDAAGIRGAGAAIRGKITFVDGRTGRAALLAGGAHIRLPSAGTLTAGEGTVEMRVRPRWAGADPGRHTLFHTGGGHAHVTIFATGGRLLLVYKADPKSWRAAAVDISGWKKDTWHRVRASWRTTRTGQLACLLETDGRFNAMSGVTALGALPAELLIGARNGREPAAAAVDDVRIAPTFTPPDLPAARANTVALSVDAGKPAGPMPRTWRFVTPWNSRTYPVPFTRDHPYFRRFREAGFDLVRMVAFSENWLWGAAVTRDAAGKIAIDFTDFDTMVDTYRAAGAEPYIRLAYHLPAAMSPPGAEKRARHYGAPRDIDEWCAFIRRIVRHCTVDRKRGIRYWVAMLNEADIAVRSGEARWEPILDLYEKTVRAVRAVDPDAKVGGPATCGPLPGVQEDGLRRFVRFCRRRDLPPDFICFHQYGCPHPRDFERAVLCAKGIVREEWPDLACEYFLDEWNLWARDKTQDNEYAAAYLAAAVHYQVRAGLDRSSIVSFNTHFPPEEVEGTGRTFRGPFRKAPGRVARFYAARRTLEGRTLPCIYTHAVPSGRAPEPAYTFGRYTLRVPDGAVLHAATAAAIDHADADGIGMSIRILAGDEKETLLERHVRKTAWRDQALPLDRFAGREVTIEFRTDCGGPGHTTVADHGLWGDPRIEAGGKRVYDFRATIDTAETGWSIPRRWHRLGTRLPMIKGRVVTPAYFTWSLLNRLRGDRLAVALDGRDGIHKTDVAGALACRDGKAVRVLLWHFDGRRAKVSQHLGAGAADITRRFSLDIAGLPARCRVRRLLIDRDHSNAYTDYVVKDKPDNGGRYNLETGTVDVVADEIRDAPGGRLRVAADLRNLSVCLVDIAPAE